MKDESMVYQLLNSRRWYEMDQMDVNYVIDQNGKVSKLGTFSILELDQKQIDKLLKLEEEKDQEKTSKYIKLLKDIKRNALSKFQHEAFVKAWQKAW